MDFSLLFQAEPTALQLAARKNEILAVNETSYAEYGLRLTEDEAEMLAETAAQAMRTEGLVSLGRGITPHIIRWFMPAGYFGCNYAAQVAELTEAFYRLRGRLQAICEMHEEPDCLLSDHAILDYMYRLYISPTCAGDIDLMAGQAEQILSSAMTRLLVQRQAERRGSAHHRTERELLFADLLADEQALSAVEMQEAEDAFDYEYGSMMHTDCFGNYEGDYDDEIASYTRGTYAEELEEALRQNPALLLPSPAQEAAWAAMTEAWDEEDAKRRA